MGSWCESNPAFSHAIIYDVLQLLCTVALDLCYIAFSDYLLTSIAQSPTSSTTVKWGQLLAVSYCRGNRLKSNHLEVVKEKQRKWKAKLEQTSGDRLVFT